jgi:hypothetical protein
MRSWPRDDFEEQLTLLEDLSALLAKSFAMFSNPIASDPELRLEQSLQLMLLLLDLVTD